jgi:hypothetical protein
MKRRHFIGIVASGFGLLTMLAGGSVLFGPESLRQAAGDVVPFVLWFNTISGAVYVLAGFGIATDQRWGAVLARLLVVAIAIVLALFLWRVASGDAWETRTLAALLFRAVFWIVVSWLTPLKRAPAT